MKQKILLVQFVFVLILGVFVLFFLNGLTLHPIKEADLNKEFLAAVTQNSLEEGEIVKTQSHGNSVTMLFKNDSGQIACATYSKSLYSRNWRQEKLYTSNMSVFNNGSVTYNVNDKLSVYSVTCTINDEPSVEFGDDTALVLSIKTFGVCVVILAAFAGRILGTKLRRR